MSLSFVKSAVLSSTDGISHNEETTINTSETASIRASSTNSASHKPLFEQLRANKEIQDAKDDEFQKSIRGMQALDDEDVAHLDAIEEQKREVEYKVKSGIEREVALFHAAREDRGLVQTVVEDQEGGDDGDGSNKNDDEDKKSPGGDDTAKISAVPAAKKQIVPKFTIKKKRKRVDPESKDDAAQKKISGSTELKKSNNNDGEKKQAEEEKPKNNNVAALLGLGCYGSDSDSD
ncbi:PSME3-interacting protein [Skeletonema marinoi]|uniref:PSME3-interacting protein n=1 Tax=Skeletonema marinoi TaxID=267567 RepID=A0AAD8YKA5_9STRA|nr:PSME3-interacting protein [Skeletonema marinoi]